MLVPWRVSVITDLLLEGLMTESVAKEFPLTACPMVGWYLTVFVDGYILHLSDC